MTIEELAAEPQVMTATGVVRVGEVVTRVPHPLVLMARVVLVRRNREAGERDARRSDGDAVDLLPVVGPRGEILVREAEHRLADLHLVDRAVAQHRRQLAERLTV